MRWLARFARAAALAGLCVAACAGCDRDVGTASAATDRKPLYYRNPMDPSVTSPVPAKDSMGMDYVPVYATATEPGTIVLSPQAVSVLGVRTAAATRERLPHGAVLSATIRIDEGSVRAIHVPIDGWVQSLTARFNGAAVARDQLLFDVYSPQLAVIDAQFLGSLRTASAAENPYERGLRSLGLNEAQIEALRAGRRAPGHLPYRSPLTGVVLAVSAREGSFIAARTQIMELAELGSVWAVVAVPESHAQSAAVGTPVRIHVGDTERRAKIDYVYPQLNPDTRTIEARAVLDNPGGVLRPGMRVRATLDAGDAAEVITVPRDAVVRTGRSDRVVRALGAGRFVATPVRVGWESGERIAILEGVSEGEQVVTAAVFLLDAEANVRRGLERLDTHAPREPM